MLHPFGAILGLREMVPSIQLAGQTLPAERSSSTFAAWSIDLTGTLLILETVSSMSLPLHGFLVAWKKVLVFASGRTGKLMPLPTAKKVPNHLTINRRLKAAARSNSI